MTTYQFDVKQVTTQPGSHSWEVHEPASGDVFALPQGGTGKLLGAYPEVEQFLRTKYNKKHKLRFVGSIDKLNLDYANDIYEWSYSRGGDEIIVRDIPRVIASVTIGA